MSSHTLDALNVTFDDDHLIADAGLIQSATLAQHLGLRALFDTHVDLGDAAGHANVGHKAMTVIQSALAGGDSIDDCDTLRAGATRVTPWSPRRQSGRPAQTCSTKSDRLRRIVRKAAPRSRQRPDPWVKRRKAGADADPLPTGIKV